MPIDCESMSLASGKGGRWPAQAEELSAHRSTQTFGGQDVSTTAPRGIARSYHGRGPRSNDARAASRRGAAATRGDSGAPGQHGTRALLASPGTLGSPPRED